MAFNDDLAAFQTLAHQGFATPFLSSSPAGGGGTTGTKPTTEPSVIDKAKAAVTGAVGGAMADAAGGFLDGLFSSRIVAIILGLIFIAGAIFLFGAEEIFSNPGGAVKAALTS